MTKWVKALRSGKYKQGANALCCDNKYCCLGVLCDVFQKEARKSKKKLLDVVVDEDTPEGRTIVSYDGEAEALPERVLDWAGLDTTIGETYRVKGDRLNKYESLAHMNDSKVKFSTIANYIERNYEAL